MISINDYCVEPNYLTPENAGCEGVLEVVRYLESIGKKGIGVGRATITIEQIDLRKLLEKKKTYNDDVPPWGACYNPLFIRFYDDPCVWTLAGEEFDAKDKEIFLRGNDLPDAGFIRSHQHALLIHGGRYGVYEVYEIHNPDDPVKDWKWKKLSYLSPEERRDQVAADLRNKDSFDGMYRKIEEITERGSIIYRNETDAELDGLGEKIRELCEQYMNRIASLEEEFHRAEP